MIAGGFQRESARYRIGPLTTFADAADLEEEFEDAPAGAQFTYAIGPTLARNSSHPTVLLVRRLHDEGRVHLKQKPDGQGTRYLIEKRPEDRSAGGAAAQIRLSDYEARLFDILRGLANRAAPLPSLDLLAEQVGLPHRQAADYRLRALIKRGLILVKPVGSARFVEVIDDMKTFPT